ncbi:DUF2062 domain-containing protein [Cyanobium gracile]|uniref:DUF2062 domain-containing protein n=1 Tax=Cyanobium gracile UHCC 0281 TaxID=3110309 RepID=A0ABU5T097_9CYAN|nr:DUF2062 domain-containing protein [Cyanobium gracile]MEA5444078.1 DUF2062 domain-containing protein [Cyanobium gracile UHCC 0281]
MALRTLRRRLRQAIEWLWRQEGSPGQRARGLAAGVFMGCFPIFGFQTLLGVALASLVRGNHLLAAAGTWISNPITYVPLYWFNYQLGCLLLGPGKGWPGGMTLGQDSLRQVGWDVTARLLLGSTVVGVVLAPLSGLLCLRCLQRKSYPDSGEWRP